MLKRLIDIILRVIGSGRRATANRRNAARNAGFIIAAL